MYSKPVKDILSDAVEASPLSLEEIATRAGMQYPSMLKMILQGVTQVPLARIPALAQGLGLEERAFLLAALQQYHSDIVNMLTKTLHLPGPDVELGLAIMVRLASMQSKPEAAESFRTALEAFLELSATQGGKNQQKNLH